MKRRIRKGKRVARSHTAKQRLLHLLISALGHVSSLGASAVADLLTEVSA